MILILNDIKGKGYNEAMALLKENGFEEVEVLSMHEKIWMGEAEYRMELLEDDTNEFFNSLTDEEKEELKFLIYRYLENSDYVIDSEVISELVDHALEEFEASKKILDLNPAM